MKLNNIQKQKIDSLMEKTYTELVISLENGDGPNTTIKQWLELELEPYDFCDGTDCWVSIIENELELYDNDYYKELVDIVKEFFRKKYNQL